MPFIALLFLATSAFATTETKYGEWVEGRRYDYRYITTFDTKRISHPMAGFPWIEQDCHDEGNRFANWSKNISYQVTYGGGLKFALLGFMEIDLTHDRSKTYEFTFQRWVVPTKGIKARNTLMEEYDVLEGETRVEYRYSDNDTEMGEEVYPFKLSKTNYGISVKREVLEVCEGY